MYTTYIPGARGAQKRVSESLDLELWVVVSYHEGARNRAWVLCESSEYS